MARPLSTIEAIKFLILLDRDITAVEIMDRLASLGHTSPSKFTVSSIRADLRSSLRVLEQARLLKSGPPKLSPSIKSQLESKPVAVNHRSLRRFESM